MNKIFVTPYFGEFPTYIQLWLDSCGRNEDFTWLLITNCSTQNLNVPSNVIVKDSTLENVRRIFEKHLGGDICLSSPYKLCDFRPAFWMILDYYHIDYDFWGYCDMDLIFGRLSHFLTDELFEKYDRLYSFGHLSLMSSSPFSKHAFMFDGSKLKWDNIFFKEDNIGFDEYHGVNKIWKKRDFLFYEKGTEMIDVDPQYDEFSFTHLPSNKKNQFFYVEDGKVLQGYFDKNDNLTTKEYVYIHFQKRQMPIVDDLSICNRFMISEKGFECLEKLPDSHSDVSNSTSFGFKVFNKKIRTTLRFYKNRLLDVI